MRRSLFAGRQPGLDALAQITSRAARVLAVGVDHVQLLVTVHALAQGQGLQGAFGEIVADLGLLLAAWSAKVSELTMEREVNYLFILYCYS